MKHVHQAACFHSDSSVGLKEERQMVHSPHGEKTKQKNFPIRAADGAQVQRTIIIRVIMNFRNILFNNKSNNELSEYSI